MFRRTGRGRLLLVTFLALSVVIITLDFQTEGEGPLDRARDVTATIVAPIQRGVSVVVRPVRNFFSSIGDLSSLRTENAELREQLGESEVQTERATETERAYEELLDENDLGKPYYGMESVTADVIAEQVANYTWAVTISKGSEDGIRPNMAVVDNSAGGLVGKTVDVRSDTATVLLLIDPRAAARATVSDAGNAGLIKGNGAGEDLSLNLVGPDVRVEEGDAVETSYYNGGVFPPRVPIGSVSQVSGDEAALDQDIFVEPNVDFDNLQTLTVLLETGPVEEKPKKRKDGGR